MAGLFGKVDAVTLVDQGGNTLSTLGIRGTGGVDVLQVQSYFNTATSNQIVLDTTRGVALDMMELADGASPATSWDLIPFNAAGTLLSGIGNAIPYAQTYGKVLRGFAFEDIYSGSIYLSPGNSAYVSPVFQETFYNGAGVQFKAALVRPLVFPFGLQVVVTPAGTAPSLTVNLYGRYLS